MRVPILRPLVIIGMSRQKQAHHPASFIVGSVNDAGRDFPVNVLALPGAPPNQYNGYDSVGDMVISDSPAYFVQGRLVS